MLARTNEDVVLSSPHSEPSTLYDKNQHSDVQGSVFNFTWNRNIQTAGAGPSRSGPPPAIVLPPNAHVSPGDATIRVRTPTRTATLHQEVELGTYLVPNRLNVGSGLPSPSNTERFPRRGSAGSGE